jgi:MFS family permease
MVLYIVESILLVLVVFVASWISDKFSKFASMVFLVLPVIFSLFLGNWIPTLESVPIRFRVLFGEPFERILVSPLYFATIVTVILVLFELRKKKLKRDHQILLISSFGALSVIQLYPQSDVMHLWWIAPLIIPALATWLVKIKTYKPSWEEAFYRTTTVFSICGFVFAVGFLNSNWKEFDNQAFAGTSASPEKVESLKIYNRIAEYTVKKNSSFDCPDGVYSVINRGYNAADQWYVNWGFPESISQDIGRVRFICGKNLSYAESEAKRLGWDLVEFKVSPLNPEVSLAVLKPYSDKQEINE